MASNHFPLLTSMFNHLNIVKRAQWGAGLIKDDGSYDCYNYLTSEMEQYFNFPASSTEEEKLINIYQGGRIIVHHADAYNNVSDEDAMRSIYHFHTRDRQWLDIAYHFLIGKNGKIYQGRPLYLMGGHAGAPLHSSVDCANPVNDGKTYHDVNVSQDFDFRSIGISLIGDYDEEIQPPAIQMTALRDLIDELSKIFNIQFINGHRFYKNRSEVAGATTCPGDYAFDFLHNEYSSIIDTQDTGLNQLASHPIRCSITCVEYSKRLPTFSSTP
ncbi:MAG: N-acetylmuramoyl-L-alanine amidase [Halobacteriovoraceae bacterium]|nr:N-acetylmuramoyl-L-alanine amidase [Halobacteriovoraceae bacterium]